MNFHFPSISKFVTQSVKTISRFPFVILGALTGTISAVWLVEIPGESLTNYVSVSNLVFISALSIPVFLSVNTWIESSRFRAQSFINLVASFTVLGILALYYFSLSDNFPEPESELFIRYLLFFLAAHLFVSFAPWIKKDDIDNFWEYNKTLFLHLLISVIYSAVLFAGLSIAMLSIDNLLDLDIDPDRYFQLWVILVGLFNTLFFLSGVPQPDDLLPEPRNYPNGLKIFVQYILIPLVVIYIFILYLYTGKILLEWQWPNGWVANLVLSFSIVGIFSLLLLHPIRNKENNRWIRLFSRGYYVTLIPLIILLVLSIWVRISEYGITVNRYFVATLAVWLTGIVIYFLVQHNSRNQNIKVIPVSLFVLTILISFGPLGAFEVSKRSQIGRLEQVLNRNQLLSGDVKIVPATHPVSIEDQMHISSIITYIVNLKGTDPLQPLFDIDLTTVIDSFDGRENTQFRVAEAITGLIGIDYVSPLEIRSGNTDAFNFNTSQNSITTISGYDYYMGQLNMYPDNSELTIPNGDESWHIQYSFREDTLIIEEQNSGIQIETPIKIWAQELFDTYPDYRYRTSSTPLESMSFQIENEEIQALILIRYINGDVREDIDIQNFAFELFLSKK